MLHDLFNDKLTRIRKAAIISNSVIIISRRKCIVATVGIKPKIIKKLKSGNSVIKIKQ